MKKQTFSLLAGVSVGGLRFYWFPAILPTK